MARRSFLAELLHQSKVAAREQRRAQEAAVRAHSAAVRRAEQAQRASRAAQRRLDRASEAERKRLEKEAREAHIADMEAKAEESTLQLAEVYADLDSLLASTLDVDDYVDLETFRVAAVHPSFDREDLEVSIPLPAPIPDPPQPILVTPDPPKGLTAVFKKSKYEAILETAHLTYAQAVARWREELELLPERRKAAMGAHTLAELQRITTLEAERARYSQECAVLDAEAAERNSQLDTFIANLGYGSPEAVQEYLSIVLSNSVYPEHFEVTHEFKFDPSSAELDLRVRVPGPDRIPTIKSFKYTKAKDEITAMELSQKACRDRYASVVHQVALRSIHEVFESDRRSLIKLISLEVGTETVDPATGQLTYVPLVVLGTEREAFLQINLSAVVPARTLDRLGAGVSKNPYGLVAAESGVRRS